LSGIYILILLGSPYYSKYTSKVVASTQHFFEYIENTRWSYPRKILRTHKPIQLTNWVSQPLYSNNKYPKALLVERTYLQWRNYRVSCAPGQKYFCAPINKYSRVWNDK